MCLLQNRKQRHIKPLLDESPQKQPKYPKLIESIKVLCNSTILKYQPRIL